MLLICSCTLHSGNRERERIYVCVLVCIMRVAYEADLYKWVSSRRTKRKEICRSTSFQMTDYWFLEPTLRVILFLHSPSLSLFFFLLLCYKSVCAKWMACCWKCEHKNIFLSIASLHHHMYAEDIHRRRAAYTAWLLQFNLCYTFTRQHNMMLLTSPPLSPLHSSSH